MVTHRSISDYKRALRNEGTCVIVGGSIPALLQTALLGSWISRTRKVNLLVHKPNKEDLDIITALFEAGKVVPVIDKCYLLREVPEALRYFGEGHVQGKVVITM